MLSAQGLKKELTVTKFELKLLKQEGCLNSLNFEQWKAKHVKFEDNMRKVLRRHGSSTTGTVNDLKACLVCNEKLSKDTGYKDDIVSKPVLGSLRGETDKHNKGALRRKTARSGPGPH